jgi:ABC-type uncharacterized transport system involved in gliding motility auxiliary subunit
MKKNALETFLYSIVGVILLLLVLVAFNVVASVFKQRVDLTKEKAYTLSEGTRAILGKIKNPLTIKFYYSASVELPPNGLYLKTYAQHVQDLIAEYKQAAKGKLIIEQLDPKPDSDAEDAAKLDGVEGQALPTGDSFYLGACVKRLDSTEVIPFFQSDRERLLEYDLSRAISRVITPEKPVIGVMSGEAVFGSGDSPMMEEMGQHAKPAWALIGELRNDFDVRQVEMTADKIDDAITVLLVIRPTQITDKTQFAIDQFLMRGGKLAACLDPVSLVDRNSGNQMMGGQMPGGGSTLDKLLKAWGLQFDDGKAVADVKYMNQKVRLSNGDNPGWIDVSGDGLNSDDVVTSEAGELWIPFGGAFTGTPVAGLKETVLAKSSKDAELVDGMMAAISGDSVMKEFKATGIEYPLAVRLTGKFKTAFPDGAPAEDKTPDDVTVDTNKPRSSAPSLKESPETAVVLVGSSDMFYNDFCLETVQTPFGNMASPRNGNLGFVQSIVENLSGDSDLISVRSRATSTHPFTRIEQMQAKAEEIYQDKINEYQQTLEQTREKLSELQKTKAGSQQFILSPEQQAELKNLQGKEAETDRALKEERKKLAADINATENRLKWGNIIGMPTLVAVSGLCLAVIKRKRTSAK